MSNTNTASGKGAGIATATQTTPKVLAPKNEVKKTEGTPKEEPKPTVNVNVNVSNTANSEAKAEAIAEAKAEQKEDIHAQTFKFEKLRGLFKQRETLINGRKKIADVIAETNDRNPIQVTFADAEFNADEYTFGNENLVKKTAEFVVSEFNAKLAEVDGQILQMKIS